ncbi:MAG: RNA methyltransferase [Desulfovibrio sp.]|jgi:23S rRNA (guanosine2251-2'-O)-methyltransferase|nr:RNA methyltransferase [Desulfovibrio sp.]
MIAPPFPKPAARRAPASRKRDAPEQERKRRRPETEPSAPPAEAPPLLTGIKPVLEMLESSPERLDSVFLRKGRHVAELDRILDLCRARGVRFFLLEAERFARLRPGSCQGVAARLYDAGFTDCDLLASSVMDAPLPLLLFLDQVQDPGNAGVLARTLYALGGAGLIIPRHNGVYLGAGAAKASAGALARLPVAKAANLGQELSKLANRGFTLYGTTTIPRQDSGDASTDLFSLTPLFPAALVLGSEEDGLRPGVSNRCHHLLHIPLLRTFDSLNVAQAGAIIIGWFSRHAPSGQQPAPSPRRI